MHKAEPVKRIFEKATGLGIPAKSDALARVKYVRPHRMKFRGDGYIPNNTDLPLLHYRKVVRFDRSGDPAALLEAIFNANGWGDAWRDGIYRFVHYHPRIHEVLGVARGAATVRLGGNKGVTVRISAGDVILVPAGVGHECLSADTEFLVVGAYPPTGTYSECRGSFREYEKARAHIRRVARPKRNPLFGSNRPIW
jgi:uncharacterized protein YjlB